LVILVIGIAVIAGMVALSVGLAFCAALVARRSDDVLEGEVGRRLAPPPLPDEPVLPARRFARDPQGRPIAAPRPNQPVHAARR
jgi:hypothetical protein